MRNRTADLLLTMETLYRLSYRGERGRHYLVTAPNVKSLPARSEEWRSDVLGQLQPLQLQLVAVLLERAEPAVQFGDLAEVGGVRGQLLVQLGLLLVQLLDLPLDPLELLLG